MDSAAPARLQQSSCVFPTFITFFVLFFLWRNLNMFFEMSHRDFCFSGPGMFQTYPKCLNYTQQTVLLVCKNVNLRRLLWVVDVKQGEMLFISKNKTKQNKTKKFLWGSLNASCFYLIVTYGTMNWLWNDSKYVWEHPDAFKPCDCVLLHIYVTSMTKMHR